MVDANKVSQLTVTTKNKPGMLAQVTSTIKAEGINISAICAYGMEEKAIFLIITTDNAKAKGLLTAKGWEVKYDEVVIAALENKIGALNEISEKFRDKGINLIYCYGSTCDCKCACNFIFKSENNDQALGALE